MMLAGKKCLIPGAETWRAMDQAMNKAAISSFQAQGNEFCAGNKGHKLQARPMLSLSGGARASRSLTTRRGGREYALRGVKST
jgi:hypothetical protein